MTLGDASRAAPEDLGPAYEATLSAAERRRTGAFYTPTDLATELASATLGPLLDAGTDPEDITVCDPAVGGGSLLLAAARVLIARGADPLRVIDHQLRGTDTDPAAVDVSRRALRMLAGGGGAPGIVVGDSLASPAPARFVDAVITNPPFLNQLRTATVRGDAPPRWRDAAKGYADTANLFLLLSVDLVRPGGRIGIILPESILATRDAAPTRRAVGASTTLEHLSRPGRGAFDAGIRVCVAVLAKQPPPRGASLWRRGDWAALASNDVPAVDLDPSDTASINSAGSTGSVGDQAAVTADFRDQYYGTAAVAVDAADGGPPIITCGLIDPARIRWGERTARVARTAMLHPCADLERADPAIRRWAAARMVPKIMVATQTRILEAAADEHGRLLPMVPVITVVPEPGRMWHLLAVLNSPPLAAHAHRAHTGAALSADAIKLSARQVAALPLPRRSDAWDRAAALAKTATRAPDTWRAALGEMGALMCDAYNTSRGEVLAWWSERLDRIASRA